MQEVDNFGQNRQILRFCGEFGNYSYRDWDFRRRGLPSFRSHVRFWGEFGFYRYRDWDSSMSGPPELPSSRAINFVKVADTFGVDRSFYAIRESRSL